MGGGIEIKFRHEYNGPFGTSDTLEHLSPIMNFKQLKSLKIISATTLAVVSQLLHLYCMLHLDRIDPILKNFGALAS